VKLGAKGLRGEAAKMAGRRDFMKTLGAAALGYAFHPLAPSPYPPAPVRKLDRIGVQLYSVRKEMEKDFEGTLAKVAATGYTEVEFAGYFGKKPADVRAILERHGLSAPAAHVGLGTADEWRAALDAAQVIGHRYLVVAWIPAEARRTIDDCKRVAASFNRSGEAAQTAGIQFGYHNHDFEFVPVEGRMPFDLLLAETDPKLVQFEMDLYWITKGGQDPLAYFARYPGRFPMVHVKDSMGPPEHKMVDVGAGSIDFRKIFARREQAGIRHYFVEHDQPRDPFASIRASYEYLRRLEF
jgi:sugar phosphate isomerase/epimerase